jgi:superfamily II DNA or RNA helicase
MMVDEDPQFLDKYGILILDEVQDCPAKSIMKIINTSASKYRIGISATPQRKDGLEILTYDIFGPILDKIEAKDIKHRITGFEYEVVNTNLYIELPSRERWYQGKWISTLDMTAAMSDITNNKERNDLIIQKLKACIEEGYFPIVLSLRVEQLQTLSYHLTDIGIKNALILGPGPGRKKVDIKEIADDDTYKCVVAQTTIMEKGIDIPRLDALHIICPGSNLPKLRQALGRIRRVLDGKKFPKAYLYVDNLAYFHENGDKKFILRYGAKKVIKYFNELIASYNENSEE